MFSFLGAFKVNLVGNPLVLSCFILFFLDFVCVLHLCDFFVVVFVLAIVLFFSGLSFMLGVRCL